MTNTTRRRKKCTTFCPSRVEGKSATNVRRQHRFSRFFAYARQLKQKSVPSTSKTSKHIGEHDGQRGVALDSKKGKHRKEWLLRRPTVSLASARMAIFACISACSAKSTALASSPGGERLRTLLSQASIFDETPLPPPPPRRLLSSWPLLLRDILISATRRRFSRSSALRETYVVIMVDGQAFLKGCLGFV